MPHNMLTKMSQRTRTTAIFLSLLALTATPTMSVAGPLTGQMTLTLDSQPYGAPWTTYVQLYDQQSGGRVVVDGSGYVAQGGAFSWTIDHPQSSFSGLTFVDPVATAANHPAQLLTFCIEFNQNIWWHGTFGYQLVPLNEAPQPSTLAPISYSANGNAPPGEYALDSSSAGMGPRAVFLIEQLWRRNFESIFQPNLNDPSLISTDPNILAGAFQLAIWKLEYDANDPSMTYANGNLEHADFSSGYLRVTSGLSGDKVVVQSQKWIDGLSLDYHGPLANLIGLSAPTFQDQVAELAVSPFDKAVPEPAQQWIWLVVFGAFVGCARIRLRRRIA